MSLQWPKSLENNKAQFPKSDIFVGQKSIFRHHSSKNVTDRIQIRLYKINKERETNFSQSIPAEVKKILRVNF